MPTLMSKETFTHLNALRDAMTRMEPAGVMLPYAGERLKTGVGGTYFIGIATDGEYEVGAPSDYSSRLDQVERFVRDRDRAQTPFWNFIDRYCKAVHDRSFDQIASSWGWSNMVKIGARCGVPSGALIEKQRDACVSALAEELRGIRRGVVVVLTNTTHEILERALESLKGHPPEWDRTYEEAGLHFLDLDSDRRVIHAYHPRHARQRAFFDQALAGAVELGRDWARG